MQHPFQPDFIHTLRQLLIDRELEVFFSTVKNALQDTSFSQADNSDFQIFLKLEKKFKFGAFVTSTEIILDCQRWLEGLVEAYSDDGVESLAFMKKEQERLINAYVNPRTQNLGTLLHLEGVINWIEDQPRREAARAIPEALDKLVYEGFDEEMMVELLDAFFNLILKLKELDSHQVPQYLKNHSNPWFRLIYNTLSLQKDKEYPFKFGALLDGWFDKIVYAKRLTRNLKKIIDQILFNPVKYNVNDRKGLAFALSLGIKRQFHKKKLIYLLELVGDENPQVCEAALMGLILALVHQESKLMQEPELVEKLLAFKQNGVVQAKLKSVLSALQIFQAIYQAVMHELQEESISLSQFSKIKSKVKFKSNQVGAYFKNLGHWFIPIENVLKASRTEEVDALHWAADLLPNTALPTVLQQLFYLSNRSFPNHEGWGDLNQLLRLEPLLIKSFLENFRREGTSITAASIQNATSFFVAFLANTQLSLIDPFILRASLYETTAVNLISAPLIDGVLERQSILIDAKMYMNSGDLERALTEFQILVSLDQKDYWAWYYLGIIYQEMEDFEKSVSSCSHALSLIDDKGEINLIMGVSYEKMEAYNEAILCFRDVIQEEPDHEVAHYNMGVAYGKLGKLEEAVQSYQRVLQLDPEEVSAWFNLGVTYRRLEEFEYAINCYLEASKLTPDDYGIWVNLGFVYWKIKAYPEVINAFEKALSLKDSEFMIWFILGNAYKLTDDPEQARRCFETAQQLEGDDPRSYYELANLLRREGSFVDAIEYYDKTLTLDPEHVDALNWRGSCKADLGELDGAIADYQQAVIVNPDYYYAYYNLGMAYEAKEEFDNAIDAYQNALKIEPTFAAAWYSMGLVFGEKGELENAKNAYERAIELIPSMNEAWNNLGIIYSELGAHDEAIRCYEEALKYKPDKWEAWFNKGIDFGFLGQFEDAVACFDEALKIEPDEPEVLMYKGMALLILGEFRKAIQLSETLSTQTNLSITALVFKSFAFLGLTNLEAALNAATKIWLISKEKDARAAMTIAHVYAIQGEDSAAINWYQKSFDLYPSKEVFLTDLWDDYHFMEFEKKGLSSVRLEILLKKVIED